MKIYVGHSNSHDFAKELYQPLKHSSVWEQHIFILPHHAKSEPTHSKDIILNCDLFLAEATYPSTGLGIELGWANVAGCKILCIYKENSNPLASLKIICSNFISHLNSKELINKLDSWIEKNSNRNQH